MRNTVSPARQHDFAKIQAPQVQRSKFDRSRVYKTTLKAAELVPIVQTLMYPGETAQARLDCVLRLLSPLKTPMMDVLYLDVRWFFIPLRLVWNHWEEFQGYKPLIPIGDNPEYTIPYLIGDTGYLPVLGDLGDYLGLPLEPIQPTIPTQRVSALYFRAYHLVWNDWFRDQDLQAAVAVPMGDGPDDYGTWSVTRRRGKRHDYFTSARPWPQKGPSVPIPWENSGQAPVFGTGPTNFWDYDADSSNSLTNTTEDTNQEVIWLLNPGAAGHSFGIGPEGAESGEYTSNVYADVGVISASINALREAMVVQQIWELDARGGTRYVEAVWSRFKTRTGDARLQRPEYIGGGESMMNVKVVPQTSESGETPQGTLTGYAQLGSDTTINYSSSEHGILMALASIRAPLTYQSMLDRELTYRTRHDFYEPLKAHLGEQAVLTQEIFFPPGNPDDVWGYQERYAEMRYMASRVTGLFRSGVAGSLDIFHMALDFESAPALDATFIEDDPPVTRISAEGDTFILDTALKLHHTRPLPMYGTPGLRRF